MDERLADALIRDLETIAEGTAGAAGDAAASARVAERLYDELHRIAVACFRDQPGDHTLQPTALVNEAWMRLAKHADGAGDRAFADRHHFLAVAATAMRQVLVDHARRRGAAKRGGGIRPFSLDADDGAVLDLDAVVEVHDALERLAERDARKARVVELRFFGGLTMPEIADVLGVSLTTVEADWRLARAWLAKALGA